MRPARAGERAHPTREDPLVRSLSEVVGGPVGDHLAGPGRRSPHRWWTPLRVVRLLTAVTLAAGMLVRLPCAQGDWQAGNLRYDQLCWSDIASSYSTDGYAEGLWPWSDDPAVRDRFPVSSQPPMATYLAWASAGVTHLVAGSPQLIDRSSRPLEEVSSISGVRREARAFTAVAAVLLAALALAAAGWLVGLDRRRPWDAAAFAASPVLALTWLTTWHLVAAAGIALSLWSWARGRPLLAGAALGLAASSAMPAALLLVPLAVVGLLDRRVLDAVLAAVGAVVTFVLVLVPAWLGGSGALRTWWSQVLDRRADLGTWWLVLEQATDSERHPLVPAAALVAAWCLGVVALAVWLRARTGRTPSYAALGALVLVGALLLGNTGEPTYALLLVPVAAVSVRRWSHLLVWQACEVLHLMLTGFYLGEALAPAAGGDAPVYWWAIGVRALGLLWLAGAVVAAQLRPWPEEPWVARAQWMTTSSTSVAV